MAVEIAKVEHFLGRIVNEMGAAMNVALVLIGDKVGLYRAMAGAGPLTSQELAAKTRADERYVGEWLCAQAAGGFVEYDAESGRFNLPDEHAAVLAQEDSPFFAMGGYQVISSAISDEPLITEAFRTGRGVGWHEHHASLFSGTDRFFRPGYRTHLVQEWIPSLDGVEAKLKTGAKVADIGCGYGSSTIFMARAFPQSKFFGFDYHDASIEHARRAADLAGVAGFATFDVASAKAFPGQDYDLIAAFDCLHDMGDPVGAARYICQALAPDGTFMIVEPYAGDHLEENLNPVGRLFYAASTMICTPGSRAQEVGLALGAQAGESRMREVVEEAGFTHFRRATQTPFNLVYEVRP